MDHVIVYTIQDRNNMQELRIDLLTWDDQVQDHNRYVLLDRYPIVIPLHEY
jgi:hypothetical protein